MSPTPGPRRMSSGFTTFRDVVTFVFGMGILVHEVWYSPEVDTAAMAIGLAMAGLPLVFSADERRRSNGSGNGAEKGGK